MRALGAVGLFAAVGCAAAANAGPGPTIAASDLDRRIAIVAHDTMQGRATGSRGAELVTAWIAAEAERIGLQPGGAGGTFFQPVVVPIRGGRTETLHARNVIAVLPGADPERSGTYVALGAHTDGLGVTEPVDHDSARAARAVERRRMLELGRWLTDGERTAIVVDMDSLRRVRPARRDSVLNGADDDASGVVALLEVAEWLAAQERRPARSVLFVWHAAEELGLHGSRRFTADPTVPRDSIIALLNADLIGRGGPGEEPGGGPEYLQVIGASRRATGLADLIRRVNARQAEPFALDTSYDAPGHPERYYCRSDHVSYARFGIPVAFFTTGGHGDYHSVTDEAQYLDYPKLVRITRLLADVTLELANLERRPVNNRPAPDPAARCRQ